MRPGRAPLGAREDEGQPWRPPRVDGRRAPFHRVTTCVKVFRVQEALVGGALTLLVGALALPLTAALFSRLPALGLSFAPPLGLLLAAFPVWVLAALGVPVYRSWSP